MFTNKHVIVAVIVAPLLAIMTYLAVDRLVSEKAHLAKNDASYPLAAQSSCRYPSGQCVLINGDLEVTLRAGESTHKSVEIQLHSSVPIDGAKIAIARGDYENAPISLQATDHQKRDWTISVARFSMDDSYLRLVVSHGSTLFYTQVDTVFLQHDASKVTR